MQPDPIATIVALLMALLGLVVGYLVGKRDGYFRGLETAQQRYIRASGRGIHAIRPGGEGPVEALCGAVAGAFAFGAPPTCEMCVKLQQLANAQAFRGNRTLSEDL